MYKKLVSIIVPVYNVQFYLNECIDSILEQTYKNIEIILIDDGSKDSSGKICDEYSNKDKRVTVIHKKNGGLSSSRNVGVNIAKGEYFLFVDSDDKLNPTAVETLFNHMEEHSLDLIFSRFSRSLEEFEKNNCSFNYYELEKDNLITNILLQRYQDLFSVAAHTKMYKANLFQNIRYPIGKLNEDMGIILLLIEKSTRIGAIDYISYYYRVNSGSITNQRFSKKRMDLIEMTQEMQNQIEQLFPNHIDEGRVLMYSRAFELYAIARETDRDNGFVKEKEDLIKIIKENRKYALKNNKARKKARISALLSYTSLNFVSNMIIYLKERIK